MLTTEMIYEARILIVDDCQSHVLLLEQVLRGAGYVKAVSTTDPFAVSALHQQHQFDLILLDLHMPGMDGFNVIAELRALNATGYLPIMAISVDPNLRSRALSSGAKDFVAKPFDMVELTSRIHNMVELRLLYNKLGQLAHVMKSSALHDELTGLPNRRLLLDRLGQARMASMRSGQHVALMFLDLDNFKQINDRCGHAAGDQLLNQVAVDLQACLRECDSVARVGGDEFVVLLGALSPDNMKAATQAQRVAHKILEALQLPHIPLGAPHTCTVCVGIVVFCGNLQSSDDLMKMADLAMYQAKATGRNRSCFYDPTLQAALHVAVSAPPMGYNCKPSLHSPTDNPELLP